MKPKPQGPGTPRQSYALRKCTKDRAASSHHAHKIEAGNARAGPTTEAVFRRELFDHCDTARGRRERLSHLPQPGTRGQRFPTAGFGLVEGRELRQPQERSAVVIYISLGRGMLARGIPAVSAWLKHTTSDAPPLGPGRRASNMESSPSAPRLRRGSQACPERASSAVGKAPSHPLIWVPEISTVWS